MLLLLSGCPEPSESANLELGGAETGETGIGMNVTETGEPETPEDDDDGDDDGETSDPGYEAFPPDMNNDPKPICGDFAVQPDEDCDGWNLAFETCTTLGFAGGQLGCNDDCTFDDSGCLPPGCGNGVLEVGETCDGSPYPCWLLGYAGSSQSLGLAPCGPGCTPDESACVATCGWGQPDCFCWASDGCVDGYVCEPHPMFVNAPGTCVPAPPCGITGDACQTGSQTSGPLPGSVQCCSGLSCINGACSP